MYIIFFFIFSAIITLLFVEMFTIYPEHYFDPLFFNAIWDVTPLGTNIDILTIHWIDSDIFSSLNITYLPFYGSMWCLHYFLKNR